MSLEHLRIRVDLLDAKFVEDLVQLLDTVELVMAFEEEFGIEVPKEETDNLRSIWCCSQLHRRCNRRVISDSKSNDY